MHYTYLLSEDVMPKQSISCSENSAPKWIKQYKNK